MMRTRPFSLEHAKAGAPIGTCSGKAVYFVVHIAEAQAHSRVIVRYPDGEIGARHEDGRHFSDAQCPGDLVMTPLGHVDGKPVFVGDELVDPSGTTFTPGPRDGGHLAGCRWPAPAKQYPVTALTFNELHAAYARGRSDGDAIWNSAGCEAVANAALRHAIDLHQVVPAESFDEVLRERDAFVTGRAARDMAIAEAVCERARRIASTEYGPDRICNGIASLDLAAIIAEVKP